MRLPELYGKTLSELQGIASLLKLPSFTGKQLSEWLYRKNADNFDQMTNLSKESRRILSEQYSIGRCTPEKCEVSTDGTKKYLFPVLDGKFIESVFIPEKSRNTLCISSQAGCRMGCQFCMTGKQGFQGNLSSGEMLNQISSLPERNALTNIVFMGMGEPLANTDNVIRSCEVMTSDYGFGWSPSRITISTIGLLPGLEKVIEKTRCHIAISLHNPFPQERLAIMPAEKHFPIHRIIDVLKKQQFKGQRRISFEYIMFRDFNDTPRHINGLTRLLNGLKCRINLIRYHEIPDSRLKPSPDETILWFKDRLNEKGILTTIRASRGKDILAACGMLSTLHSSTL